MSLWRDEILECRQLQPPKRTNLKELGRNIYLHVIMLDRPETIDVRNDQ